MNDYQIVYVNKGKVSFKSCIFLESIRFYYKERNTNNKYFQSYAVSSVNSFWFSLQSLAAMLVVSLPSGETDSSESLIQNINVANISSDVNLLIKNSNKEIGKYLLN